ncbi:DUF2339 domain-containing protein, partial [bacterium]|nr:DUF2339 domain-containing protein [bacterium]
MKYLLFVIIFIFIINQNSKISRLESEISGLQRAVNNLLNKIWNIERTKTVQDLSQEKKQVDLCNEPQKNKDKTEVQQPPTENKDKSLVSDVAFSFKSEADEEEAYYYEEDDNNETKTISQRNISFHKQDKNFEELFFGNIFNIVGAIAIISAFIIFVKLIIPFIHFTPMMKTVIGFVAGILFLLFGFHTATNPKLKQYSEIITGTGFAILFINTSCSTILYNTFSIQMCAFIGGIILMASYFIADKQKTISMLAISLLGGYLNLFTCLFKADISFIFGYLIFLNIVSLIFAYRNPDKSPITFINLAASLLVFSGHLANFQACPIAYPLVLWAIYLIYDIVRTDKSSDEFNISSILNVMNIGILTVFTYRIFPDDLINIGILLLSTAIIYGIIVFVLVYMQSERKISYIHSMLLCILISTFFLTTGIYTVMLLSLEALIYSIITSLLKLNYSSNWILAYFMAAFTKLIFLPATMQIPETIVYTPLFTERLFPFASIIIASFISSKLLKKSEIDNNKKAADILQIIYSTLIPFYAILEFNDFYKYKYTSATNNDLFFIKSMTFAIIGFIYSLQMNRIYEQTKIQVCDLLSKAAYYFSIAGIVLLGTRYIPQTSYLPVFNIRLFVFLVAIGFSIYYGKKYQDILYKYIAVVLGFLLIHYEIVDSVNVFSIGEYLISICWIIYLTVISSIGIIFDKKYFKNSAIALFLLCICRIFIYDMANVEMQYKLLVTLILGGILL